MHGILLAACLGGCAHPLPPVAAPPDLGRFEQAIDWRSAGDEAARVLAGYLRVDTVNPPGNETRGAEWMAAILAREGIASEILEFAPGRGSLIARLRADGAVGSPAAPREGPLCLLSHIDVASAEAKDWPADRGPLSGAIDDKGMIWGRGALDMKGMGAIELMTMIWVKRLGLPLRRDLVLVAVADEEVGNLGMQFMVEKHWDRIGCQHVVNEGGIGIRDLFFPGQTVFPITVVEKGALWLRMSVRGAGGHGSTPRHEHTPRAMLRALERIERREVDISIHPSLRELLARIGAHHGGGAGFVLRRPALVDALLEGRLMGNPATRAAITDTISITGLDAGVHAPNVVPTTTSAILDVRLQPGVTAEQMIARLQALVGEPEIKFETLFWLPAMESPWIGDPFFQALSAQIVAGRKDAVAGPALSVGYTDSLQARRAGARAYGLVPFDITQEDAATMHGPNERVSIENVRNGLRILFRVVVQSAADLSRPPPAGPPRRAPVL